MSGTSADGIDAALVRIEGSGLRTTVRPLGFRTYPYPRGFREFLLKNSDPATARLDDLARLDYLIAALFAEAATALVRGAGRTMKEIDLIGSHGQTVQHLPDPAKLFGRNIRATLQLGNPSVIAKLTGVVTVGDFRSGDVAVGGSGAPLVPLVDYLLLGSAARHRGILNIGGIANITILPMGGSIPRVMAFDTGPGNMVIDGLMKVLYRRPFDRDGRIANRGKISPGLLRWMAAHPYLRLKPPKSTGRETFGDRYVRRLVSRFGGLPKEDVITTASEFTALSVYESVLRFVPQRIRPGELLVSGGGAHNPYVMRALQRYFSPARVTSTDRTVLAPDAKEAICFALLANETLAGHAGNVPGATGASRRTILGSVCLP